MSARARISWVLPLLAATASCGGKTSTSATSSVDGGIDDSSSASGDGSGSSGDGAFADAPELGGFDWAWQTTTPSGPTGSYDSDVEGLATDSTGGVVMIATTSETVSFGSDTYVAGDTVLNGIAVVASLDSLGHLRWSRGLRGSYGPHAARAVAVDAHDRVHVAGVFGKHRLL